MNPNLFHVVVGVLLALWSYHSWGVVGRQGFPPSVWNIVYCLAFTLVAARAILGPRIDVEILKLGDWLKAQAPKPKPATVAPSPDAGTDALARQGAALLEMQSRIDALQKQLAEKGAAS